MEKNADLIQKFTDAIYRGQVWVDTHTPEEIAAVISPSFPDTDEKMLAGVAKRYKEIDAWAKTPYFSEESFERLQTVMEMAGELDKRAPYEKLVDNSFAEQAVKNIR
jgi:NitT/TauT family transport system substrate-binding protein